MRLAVTGTGSFLGSRILRRLVASRGPDALLAVDLAAAPAALSVRSREIDLTAPAADQRLLDVFREEEVSSVLHLAFFTDPRRDAGYAHELESIGTLAVLAAAAAAGVRHVVMRSWTAVYGASGQNPSFLTEDAPLLKRAGLPWLRDKVEAEEHAASFARRYPELAVTSLRFAPLFGPGVHNFYTRIFDKRLVPVLLGYDPLMQLLHPEDALTAIETALLRRVGGAFNVVPEKPITLLTSLHLAEKVPLAVPHPAAYAAADLLWAAGIGKAPGAFVDYVRFPFVADGARAERELGFRPRFTSRESLREYLRYRYPVAAEPAPVSA